MYVRIKKRILGVINKFLEIGPGRKRHRTHFTNTRFKVDFHCRVTFTCVLRCVNKIKDDAWMAFVNAKS